MEIDLIFFLFSFFFELSPVRNIIAICCQAITIRTITTVIFQLFYDETKGDEGRKASMRGNEKLK